MAGTCARPAARPSRWPTSSARCAIRFTRRRRAPTRPQEPARYAAATWRAPTRSCRRRWRSTRTSRRACCNSRKCVTGRGTTPRRAGCWRAKPSWSSPMRNRYGSRCASSAASASAPPSFPTPTSCGAGSRPRGKRRRCSAASMTDAAFAALASARQAAGLTLEEAARQLKFAPRQLEALEAGELRRLPGGTFVRGMVRSYARLLRIDPEPLLAQIAAQVPPPDAERLAQRYRQPVPFTDGARRSNLAYVALSLVLLVAVAAVALQWRQGHAHARLRIRHADARRACPRRRGRRRCARRECALPCKGGAAKQARGRRFD